MSHFIRLVCVFLLFAPWMGYGVSKVIASEHVGAHDSRACTAGAAGCAVHRSGVDIENQRASTLFDLSGIGWLGNNTFVVMHDSKNNSKQLDRPRVSILVAPGGLKGEPKEFMWRQAGLTWPDSPGPSNDLESVSAIPGTNKFLLVESGDDQRSSEQPRLFLVEYDEQKQKLTLRKHRTWPDEANVFNVEATAVAENNGRYVFVYAERAHNKNETNIYWARFYPKTKKMEFGRFRSVSFANPDPAANRPIVGMDIDQSGVIYTVAAYDPDIDTGPFSSTIWKIGKLTFNKGKPKIVLDHVPKQVGKLDGLKVESVVVESPGKPKTIYVGTDGEDLGNVLRPLPSGSRISHSLLDR